MKTIMEIYAHFLFPSSFLLHSYHLLGWINMWCDWSEPYNAVYTEIVQELELASQLHANTIRTFVQFSAVELNVSK